MSKNDLEQNKIINSLIKADKDLGKFIKFFEILHFPIDGPNGLIFFIIFFIGNDFSANCITQDACY